MKVHLVFDVSGQGLDGSLFDRCIQDEEGAAALDEHGEPSDDLALLLTSLLEERARVFRRTCGDGIDLLVRNRAYDDQGDDQEESDRPHECGEELGAEALPDRDHLLSSTSTRVSAPSVTITVCS